MSASNNPFSHFGLEKYILSTLLELGYEKPTPVQLQGIPILLNGHDLLAQAQTGTGKTATFALPILSRLDLSVKSPQALVLTPTRELAIQVAEAFQSYAKHMKDFLVTPIYGGQDFKIQLRLLKRGPQVIVGTPGRLMDHLRRRTLPFDTIKTVVLDEADEMLRMGFVDDVEWILGQINHAHQTALFSATLPASIQKIAQKYLKNPEKVQIQSKTNDQETIEQCYVTVSRNQKLDMLTRFLEAEDILGMIVFARTKNESAELSEKLQARGYKASALNGDMSQSSREKTIDRLRAGHLDILVATDVAARGIDVERITHVVNYDIPYDVDSYVHRIGRTGRAGREGKAILFVTPREMYMLNDIEKHMKKPIKRAFPPSLQEIRDKRTTQTAEKIVKTFQENKTALTSFVELVKTITDKHTLSPTEVAATLLYLDQEQNVNSDVSDEALKPDTSSHRKDNNSRRSSRPWKNDERPRNRDRSGGNRFGSEKKRDERFSSSSSDRPARSRFSSSSDKPAHSRYEKTDRPAHSRYTASSDKPAHSRFEKTDRPARSRFESSSSDKPAHSRFDKKKQDKKPYAKSDYSKNNKNKR